MTTVSKIVLALGGLHAVLGAWWLAAPESARAAVKGFPRHRLAGWLLAAAALAWAGSNVYHAELGRFSYLKPWIFGIVPALIALVGAFMNELLAPRALGSLMLLAAAPILKAVQFHESKLSLAVTVMAYVWVVLGMAWVLGPYRFRRWVSPLSEVPGRQRATGAGLLAAGVAFLALGLTVLR
jgi:uncharacterized protein YjeT (DUF2065 family)